MHKRVPIKLIGIHSVFSRLPFHIIEMDFMNMSSSYTVTLLGNMLAKN